MRTRTGRCKKTSKCIPPDNCNKFKSVKQFERRFDR